MPSRRPTVAIQIVTLLIIFHERSKGETPSSVFNTLQDNLQASSDVVTQDLFEKYSEIDPTDFWHHHPLTSSTTSREVVRVQSIEKRWILGRYLQWRYVRAGFYHYIIGITLKSVDVFDVNYNKTATIDSSHSLVSFTVFSRWNFEEACPEVVIPVATSKSIEIYKLKSNVLTKVNDGWPLNFRIKALEYSHVGVSTKLVVIPDELGYPVSIYNLAINSTNQIWYHQRLPVTGRCYVSVYEFGSESYIAVASDSTVSIYGYDNNIGRYSEQQVISLNHPSQQLVSFSVAYKHYLASVPSISTAQVEFFGFNGHQYTRDTAIASLESTELRGLNVEDYRDEHFVLSKGRRDGQIHVFSYDGQSFTADEYKCAEETCYSTATLQNGVGYTIKDVSFFILPTPDRGSQAEVLVISKYTQDSVSPLFKESNDIISQLKALLERYKRWEGIVESSKEILMDSLSRTAPNDITGKWILDSLRTTSLLITGNKVVDGNPFNQFSFLGNRWSDSDFTVPLSGIDEIISQMKGLTEEAKFVLKDSISINSENLEVVTAAQRVTGSFSANELNLDNLIARRINHELDVDAFLSSFVLFQKSLQLDSSGVRFRGKLGIENLYTTKLNGILVDDIAHLRKPNHFECDLELKNVQVYGDVKVNKVNGVRFKEDIIRATEISGVRLVDGIVSSKGAVLKDPVDSVHINRHTFQNLLLCTTTQRIQIPYRFSEIYAEGSAKVGSINGVDVTAFLRSVVMQTYNGIIRGVKRVKGSLSAESLHIESMLNKFAFPQDVVTASQKRIKILGMKTFTHLTATKVSVDGLIDGIVTSDLVSRYDNEAIPGNWILGEGAVFLRDLTVKGYVDGVKMETLKHTDTLDQYQSSYYPNADIEFLQPVTFRNLKVQDNINNKPFKKVFGGVLSLESMKVNVTGTTTFERRISAKNLHITSGIVNGISLKDFFSVTEPHNVTGHKTFAGDVRFGSLYALSTFDSVDLKALLNDAFRLSKPRTVASKLSFEDVHCSRLIVEGAVNGVENFGESVAVITGKREQVFASLIEIQDLTVGSLEVIANLDVRPGRAVDGLDFNSWNRRRVSLSKEFRTSKPVEFTGEVLAKQRSDIRTLNGVTLSYLGSSVLRTDRDTQTFTKKFSTTEVITVENGVVRFDREVCGLDLNRVFGDGVPLHGDNEITITGNWKFQSPLHVGSELIVEGTTCGVDLAKLDADSLRSGESNVYFSGETTFLSTVDVKQDFYVGKINGEDLFSYVFTLNRDQQIKGKFHFGGNVDVQGELECSGFINSVSLKWLRSVYSCENGTTHVLKCDIDGDAALSSHSLAVNNLVQGMDLKKFMERVVNIDDTREISGHKTFTQLVRVEGNMSVDIVNETPVARLNSVMLKTRPELFTHPVMFTGSVEASILKVAGDVNYNGLISDYNLTELVAEAAYLNSHESLGTMSMDSAVMGGDIDDVQYLNGVSMEKLILLDQPQELGNLNVKEAIVDGSNVVVGGVVCGYNILEEYQRTLYRNSNSLQTVKGTLTFNGDVVVNGNLQCLNELRDNLVLLEGGIHIDSPVIFAKKVSVESSLEVKGAINEATIGDLEMNYLTNGRRETISGHWTFSGGVTFKGHVTGDKQVDGYHLGELIEQKKAEALKVQSSLVAERKHFDDSCSLLDRLFRRIALSPVKLEYFESHQPSLLVKQTVREMAFLQAGNLSRLVTASGSCDLDSLEFDTKAELFKSSADTVPRLGDVLQIEAAMSEELGILVGRSIQSSSCSSSAGVYFFTMDYNGRFSSKSSIFAGNCAQFSLTQYLHKDAWRPALFLLGNDHRTVQLYLWDPAQRQFELNQEVALGYDRSTDEETVIRMKGIAYGNLVGLFYFTQKSALFQVFSIGAASPSVSVPFYSKDAADSSTNMIQVLQAGTKTFGFAEDKDSFIPSECTMQVFEMRERGISLFQRLKIPAVRTMETISFGNQHFVAFLTKDAGLELYRYKGLSGFESIAPNPLRIPGAIVMQSFNLRLWKHHLPQPFMALSTPTTILFLHSILNGDATPYDQKLTEDLCLIDSSY